MAGILKEPEEGRGSRILRYLPLGLMAVLLAAFFTSGLHRSVSFESLIENRTSIGSLVSACPVGVAILYVLIYAAMVTLSLPAFAFLAVTGGFLFGWVLGGTLAAIAATLGAASIFLIARTSLGEPLLRRAGPRLQKLAASFRADSFSYLLFLRLLPVMPFWITNLAAAFFGMRFKTFLVATQLGVIPIAYAFAIAGAGLDEMIVSQEQRLADCRAAGKAACSVDFRPESLLTSQLMVALGLLGILALGPILARKWQAGEETDG